MKTRLLTILLALGLLTIIGGASLIGSMGQAPLEAKIRFDPNFVEWDSTYPVTWIAWIQSEVWNPLHVNGSSVMFEHIVPATGGYYEKGKWIAEFDGQSVFNILSSKIGHMGIPPDISTKTPVHYYFTVSGTLAGSKDYPDGTPFEGQGWIAVRFVSGLPDPPPLPQ